MRVWIFQTGEPLHTDGGSPRPMRAMNLATALVAAGHDVTLWSSGFFHQEKRHRTRKFKRIRVNCSLEIRLIPSPGYQKNIGLGRLFDHAILARNLRKILAQDKDIPDVAFIGYPPIEFAYVAIKWLSVQGVPTMLDAKDQWPQIFVDPFPKILQPLVRLGLFPYFYMGKHVMSEATSFSSMSQSFLNWMGRFSGRSLGPLDFVAPLSPMRDDIEEQTIADALDWWGERGVCNDGKRRFFFVGTLSRAFDFVPIIDAATRAARGGKNWQFVICGAGAEAARIMEEFRLLPNVILPGWVDRPKVIALANMSTVGLAPYKNIDSFTSSIPNKIIDYLSLGKPIASPLFGEVKRLIESYEVGFIYCEKDIGSLFEILNSVCSEQSNIDQMSKNAFDLYVNNFSGEKVYQALADRLVSLQAISSNAL